MSKNRQTRRERERRRAGINAVATERERDALRLQLAQLRIEHDAELACLAEHRVQMQAAHNAELAQFARDCRTSEERIKREAREQIDAANHAAVEMGAQLHVAQARIAELEAAVPEYDKLRSRLKKKSQTITELQRKINAYLKESSSL